MSGTDQKTFTVKGMLEIEGLDAIQQKIRALNANQQIVDRMQKGSGALQSLGIGENLTKQVQDALKKHQELYRKGVKDEIDKLSKEANEYSQQLDKQKTAYAKMVDEAKKLNVEAQEYKDLQTQIENQQKNIAKIEEQRHDRLVKIGVAGSKIEEGEDKQKREEARSQVDFKKVALTAVGAIIAAIPRVIEQEGMRPITTQQATGSATQGTLGREFGSALSGDTLRELAYGPEKLRAIDAARHAQSMRQHADALNPLTTLGAGIAGGAGVGAAFAGIGAAPGAVIGGVGAMGKIGYDMMSDPRYRAAQLSPYSSNMRESYQAMQSQEFADNYLKSLEAQKDMNPGKAAGLDYMSKYANRDLSAQRMMGLSDEGLMGQGGYYNRAKQGGFLPETAISNSQGILGAGGSTRAASESQMGLFAQRNFDLTNASSVMGKISGSAGGTAASEAIFKKVMEAAIKAGLDGSEFREEQRKYAEVTASILGKAGITNAQDAESVLQGFNRFLGGDKTMKGMEGAKSAYEEYQEKSGDASGRRGAVQFSQMMKDQNLRGGSAGQLAGLMEIPDEQLSSDHPRIVAFAHQAGVDPQDIVDSLRKTKRQSNLINNGVNPKKAEELGNFMDMFGMDKGGNLQKTELDYMKSSRPDLYEFYQKNVVPGQGYDSSYVNGQKVSAGIRGMLSPNGEPLPTGAADQGLSGSGGNRLPRAFDQMESDLSATTEIVITNFKNLKDELIPATSAVNNFGKSLFILTQWIASIPEDQRNKMAPRFKDELEKLYRGQYGENKQQPQASKPSPGAASSSTFRPGAAASKDY